MTVHPVLPHLICAEFSLICTVQTLGLPRTGTRLPGEGCRLVCASRQSPSPPCAPRHREVWVRHRNGRHDCSLSESPDVLGVDEIPDPFAPRTAADSGGKGRKQRRGTTPTARIRNQTNGKVTFLFKQDIPKVTSVPDLRLRLLCEKQRNDCLCSILLSGRDTRNM